MNLERLALGVVLAATLFVAGCGDPSSGVISGSVTVGGAPLPEGTVQFLPADGKSTPSGGMVKDGRYSVKVPVGPMKVKFSAPKVVGQKKAYNTADSPMVSITAEALPVRYNAKTELTFDVKPGGNSKDWSLDPK